jgi:putative nucleotidyltransferase with HDIG domain
MDWTRTGWESIQYAVSHVKTGASFLERVRALFDMAVNQKANAKILHQMRCERGASVARKIGLSEESANAINCLNEHWNGLGQPQGLRGQEIPLLSRVMNVAQTADIFYSRGATPDASGAVEIIRRRSKRWFDPAVVKGFCSVASRQTLWQDLDNANTRVLELEPSAESIELNDTTLDNICVAFAEVIDAKSPFTYRHSNGVAAAAVAISKTLSLSDGEVAFMRRAGLLHDIGKLSVPNTILDKPDKLTEGEWDVVRRHPFYSWEVLRRIPGFHDLAEIAAAHHEKLDGSGYFRKMTGETLSLRARILVVADIYDALAAKRPYRDALPLETVLGIIGKDVPRALDPSCFEALKFTADSAPDLLSKSSPLFTTEEHHVKTPQLDSHLAVAVR